MPGVIAVFDGSGNTGREVTGAALKRGPRVRALYRRGSVPRDEIAGLEVVTGQLSAPADVRRVLEGADGAILGFPLSRVLSVLVIGLAFHALHANSFFGFTKRNPTPTRGAYAGLALVGFLGFSLVFMLAVGHL